MTTSEARCGITELLVGQCAHCRKAPEPEKVDVELGSVMDAAYRSPCGSCGDQLNPGDRIGWAPEYGWVGMTCCGRTP